MLWLKKKIDEHNSKITYVDYEETITESGWITAMVFGVIVSIAAVVYGIKLNCIPLIIVGLILLIVSVGWHLWYLLDY
jgi:flagellar biosynthesis protein FliQ